jgi:CheY-like chemotaxis protein
VTSSSPRLILVEDNLFFHAKLKSQLESAGYSVTVVTLEAHFLAALEQPIAAILVSVSCRNIPWTRWVEQARQRLGASFPIIGYGGHVNVAGFEAGRNAGCTTIVTNGQISARAAAIVAQQLA